MIIKQKDKLPAMSTVVDLYGLC